MLQGNGLNQRERQEMAKYLQCSQCGKLAFYYDGYVGTEKPFYLKNMIYPDGTKPVTPRCFNCNDVPRLLFDFIKEDKEPLPTPQPAPELQSPSE